MKISVVSGGFDPIHSGHIAYLNAASQLGDILIVCLNSDSWLQLKKGQNFLPFQERKIILENLKMVFKVIGFDDDKEGSAINGLKKIQSIYPNDEIIFCNGGDRKKNNIPEMSLDNIIFRFSVGGDDKKNSSSWILKKWTYPSSQRIWGNFFDLFQDDYVKVKELVVNPYHGMSFQRHFYRNEIWLISHGKCEVNYSHDDPDKKQKILLKQGDKLFVPVESWHQITNPFSEECRIIEIQFGQRIGENDIERLHYYDVSEKLKAL